MPPTTAFADDFARPRRVGRDGAEQLRWIVPVIFAALLLYAFGPL
jgi:hypothetical protein